jgi:HEAT repeat protein
MTRSEFVAGLRSSDLNTRLLASLHAEELGVAALHAARDLVSDPNEADLTRVWAVHAALRLIPEASEQVRDICVGALADRYSSVRIAALIGLTHLKDPSTIAAIEPFLNDLTEDPHAWDEPSTVSGAARQALRAIGTPEALAALGSQRDVSNGTP